MARSPTRRGATRRSGRIADRNASNAIDPPLRFPAPRRTHSRSGENARELVGAQQRHPARRTHNTDNNAPSGYTAGRSINVSQMLSPGPLGRAGGSLDEDEQGGTIVSGNANLHRAIMPPEEMDNTAMDDDDDVVVLRDAREWIEAQRNRSRVPRGTNHASTPRTEHADPGDSSAMPSCHAESIKATPPTAAESLVPSAYQLLGKKCMKCNKNMLDDGKVYIGARCHIVVCPSCVDSFGAGHIHCAEHGKQSAYRMDGGAMCPICDETDVRLLVLQACGHVFCRSCVSEHDKARDRIDPVDGSGGPTYCPWRCAREQLVRGSLINGAYLVALDLYHETPFEIYRANLDHETPFHPVRAKLTREAPLDPERVAKALYVARRNYEDPAHDDYRSPSFTLMGPSIVGLRQGGVLRRFIAQQGQAAGRDLWRVL